MASRYGHKAAVPRLILAGVRLRRADPVQSYIDTWVPSNLVRIVYRVQHKSRSAALGLYLGGSFVGVRLLRMPGEMVPVGPVSSRFRPGG